MEVSGWLNTSSGDDKSCSSGWLLQLSRLSVLFLARKCWEWLEKVREWQRESISRWLPEICSTRGEAQWLTWKRKCSSIASTSLGSAKAYCKVKFGHDLPMHREVIHLEREKWSHLIYLPTSLKSEIKLFFMLKNPNQNHLEKWPVDN